MIIKDIIITIIHAPFIMLGKIINAWFDFEKYTAEAESKRIKSRQALEDDINESFIATIRKEMRF